MDWNIKFSDYANNEWYESSTSRFGPDDEFYFNVQLEKLRLNGDLCYVIRAGLCTPNSTVDYGEVCRKSLFEKFKDMGAATENGWWCIRFNIPDSLECALGICEQVKCFMEDYLQKYF